MVIYCVKYPTGYDYDEIMKYFSIEAEADAYANLVNKQNTGLDAYVSDVEVN